MKRHERLSGKEDYLRVYRKGRRIRLPGLTISLIENSLPYSRIGITIGRKFGNAVNRNRAKRLLREIFRKNKHRLPTGYDMVFSPSPQMLQMSWKELEDLIVNALSRSLGR